MIEVKAPARWGIEEYLRPTLFLGGSIEMGKAEKWQDRVVKDLSDLDITVLNPRRDDWDATWAQDPTPGTPFREQVEWELHAQEDSDVIVYYFAAGTQSPITLLELGMFMGTSRVIVCCPREFWRYGNVRIATEDVPSLTFVETYDEMIRALRETIREFE